MKFKKIFFAVLFAFLFILYSCPSVNEESVRFVNNAEHDIMIYATQHKESWFSEKWKMAYSRIPAKETIVYTLINEGLDLFYVVIIHPDTMSKYSWEAIVEEEMVLRKFEITRSELKKTNYNIAYP